MGESDAVTLFLERAQAIRADIGESPAVHELIQRLDGLPLAIELAAARVKLLGPDQLLERIAQRLDLLKGGRDADERHATLRATIAWSYDLLDAEEQKLFARLAVFRGGATLENAEEVCGADLDTLASLLDKSLVRRRTDADGEERFWMLETIRAFARERLDASGEERRVTAGAVRSPTRAGRTGGHTRVVKRPLPWSFELVAPEIDNVRAVLEWALDHDPQRGLRLATWLETYWVVRDPLEGAGWLERLLEVRRTPSPRFGRGRCGPSAGLPTSSAMRTGRRRLSGKPRAVHCGRRGVRSGAHAFPRRGEHGDERRTRGRVAAPRGKSCRGTRDRSPDRRVPGARLSADKAHRGGDVEQAIALALESAAIAAALDWRWWEAGQYGESPRWSGSSGGSTTRSGTRNDRSNCPTGSAIVAR